MQRSRSLDRECDGRDTNRQPPVTALTLDTDAYLTSREPFEDYAREWLDGYGGRTGRGISANGLADYGRTIERFGR